ncbi:MAG: CopG family transcriptional regulator [Micrococcales bacterium]|nr:CopG family transcriptional regulator [Micrococcales bacterium]MCL2668735.1 CopG family transcriptional regulator [Micrococcales bacterium]
MSSPTVEKHSVSIPRTTSEGVRARVGSRGFSAYVSQAVARQLERDALDDLVAEMDAEHGPVDEDAVAAIMARLAR